MYIIIIMHIVTMLGSYFVDEIIAVKCKILILFKMFTTRDKKVTKLTPGIIIIYI